MDGQGVTKNLLTTPISIGFVAIESDHSKSGHQQILNG